VDGGLLVLWDIDQTLIETVGVATGAYAQAIRITLGQEWRGDMSYNGLTERAMAARVLRQHGVEPEPELLARLLVAVERELLERAEETRTHGRALAGAHAALAAIGATAAAGTRQSVLTGNVRSVAEMKLRVFDLHPWVDFGIGAYGDDEHERNALIPHAWRRTEAQYGQTYSPARTVILGDTIRDVQAALTHGAAIVGVASGTTPAAELRAAGAEIVLDSLADTAAVLTAIQDASKIAGSG
jgi:phosphoglycolate phosphatase-like HAD superfamily hydrolase